LIVHTSYDLVKPKSNESLSLREQAYSYLNEMQIEPRRA